MGKQKLYTLVMASREISLNFWEDILHSRGIRTVGKDGTGELSMSGDVNQ
jgi:hypothetical protein